MLQEALEFVFDKASENAEVKQARIVTAIPTDGRTVVVEHDGTLIDRQVPPPLRGHKVESVDDLIAAGQRWNDDNVVWVSEASVILTIDDGDRREFVTLPLRKSSLFITLEGLQKEFSLEQLALVRLLRRDFREAPGAGALLTAVRKIKFRSLTEGHSVVQQGNESLGRLIENEVSGMDAGFPELFVVPSSVFANPGEHGSWDIPLDLEVSPKNQRFLLRPMPGAIEDTIADALMGIQRRIREGLGEVPVFFGRP